MIRPLAIIVVCALSVGANAQTIGAGVGQRGNAGQGGGGAGRGGNQGGGIGQGGNFGRGGGNLGQGGGQFGGNRVQGKSLFPEGVAVYGYDADNSIIIASGLTRTAGGRGLIPNGIEALYGYDADNSLIIKSGSSRQAMLNFLNNRMDSKLASMLESPAPSKDQQSAAVASRIAVTVRLSSLPPGALMRLHKLGFQSSGSLSRLTIPGTLPPNRLAIAAIQPFVQKIESAR